MTPGSAVRHLSAARHVTDCATRPDIIMLVTSCINCHENIPYVCFYHNYKSGWLELLASIFACWVILHASCLSSADFFFKLFFFQKNLKYHQVVKQFVFRSGQTKSQA